MNYQNDDVRIKQIKELLPPIALLEKFPATDKAAFTVHEARLAIHNILSGEDDRLVVVIGPCSIHDTKAALEYAERLNKLREELKDSLEIVMRVYFEKPRTTVGWKGLINDPNMDNSFNINEGLRIARELLVKINDQGLPTAGEFLDMISPQYVADLMSWGRLVHAQQNRKYIVNWLLVSLAQLALKMEQMARLRSLLMRLIQHVHRIVSYRSPNGAFCNRQY